MSVTFDPEIHAVDKDGNPSLNKDGSYRKKRSDAGNAKKRGLTSSSRGTSAKSTGQKRRYVEGVSGIFQIVAAGVSMVDPVDGFCVAQHTPPIADAVADLAVERPEVAAALEKILTVGPYGALIGAMLPLAVQIAHNHKKVPEPMARAMGASPRQDIERHLRLVAAPQDEDEVNHAAA